MSTRPFRFGVINEQMLAPSAWLAHVRLGRRDPRRQPLLRIRHV